jgi:hypothetical protein
MWRTSIVVIAFAAQIGLAQAQQCEPLPTGGLLCEQEGAILFVDPASGTVVDVTQDVLSALAGGTASDHGTADPVRRRRHLRGSASRVLRGRRLPVGADRRHRRRHRLHPGLSVTVPGRWM